MNTLSDWAPPTLPGLSKLQNSSGILYSEFRKTLDTPFKLVQSSITMNLILISSVLVFAIYNPHPIVFLILAIPLALVEHRVLNVLHEGAHYLIARKRSTNDLITNILSGWFVIADVDQYRIIHVQHHRNLGSIDDPKLSHMDKLDFTWLVSVISGFKTISIILQRKKFRESNLEVITNSSTQGGHFWVCSILGTLQQISLIKYNKPMHSRISYKILMPIFVCLDFVKIKFSNSSQQLLILGKK